MFDEIEPAACVVFLIALFTIVSFTPLSPFSAREQSTLDQFAGVNTPVVGARMFDQRDAASRMRQVEAHIDFTPVLR